MARKPVPAPSTATANTSDAAAQPQARQMGCLALVARMTWLFFGNIALLALTLSLTRRQGFSGWDVAFWSLALGLIGVRYLDVTRLGGFSTDGKPATLADWRRYSLKMLAFAVAAYGAAVGLRSVIG